jgi:hypothetical protein
MYHHQLGFVQLVKNYEKKPFVWHMCWTATREQKVEHFKDLGLWYLPDPTGPRGEGGFCENPAAMLGWVQGSATGQADVLKRCCVAGGYWERRREREKAMSAA